MFLYTGYDLFFFLFLTKRKHQQHCILWLKTRMGVRMFKVYCSSEVKQRCEVYLTWKVRGLSRVYFATDISSQEKWVVRKTRKWASWVEVTAVMQADTNTWRAGEGHGVMKRTTASAASFKHANIWPEDFVPGEKGTNLNVQGNKQKKYFV